jgi:molybdopterin-guanine dinucleotide biosynthesis protein A
MVSAVLSGGENRRFPFTKGFIELNGKRIIESTVETLKQITKKVVISTNEPESYFYLGVPLTGDIIKHAGPMGGIHSVLVGTDEHEVFVIACDMPFIKPELINYIISRKAKDATVPVFNKRPEPLLAVYTKNIIKLMEDMISKRQLALTDMLKEIDVQYIREEEVRRIDPEGRSFININTLEDFERASKNC